MVKNHLSRLAVPKSWPVEKKKTRWIAKPIPGSHSLNGSIPLSVLLRDMLQYAKTLKEIKLILNQKNILVDKKARKESRFPIGFMDVVEFPSLGEYYRMVYNKKGVFSIIPISKEQANLKLLKIIRKFLVKKGVMQLTFHDGRNIRVDQFNGNVGDTVLFDLNKKIISKIFHLDKGSLVYLNGGAHVSQLAKVKNVVKSRDLQSPKVVIDINGEEYVTLMKYAFVVGKDKPELTLGVGE
mgnify:CR=1 FL=1